jgi:hypothetical protein
MKCLQFFPWLILNFPLATAPRGTVPFPMHAKGVIKVVWYADVHLKQWGVTGI